nr:MAG TPA: hypothetical protein [Caudoviricetes sp.]
MIKPIVLLHLIIVHLAYIFFFRRFIFVSVFID